MGKIEPLRTVVWEGYELVKDLNSTWLGFYSSTLSGCHCVDLYVAGNVCNPGIGEAEGLGGS